MSKVLHHVSASVLALVTGLLPLSQSVAGESSVTLTLKTRYTAATCLFTRNGADATGVQVVTMPSVDPKTVSGSGEWMGEVVPLNLGMRCSRSPEENVGIALTVTPGDGYGDSVAGNHIIASKKTTGNNVPGPDLLLVDTAGNTVVTTFSPGLALPGLGGKCSGDISPGAGTCLQMSGTQPDYRIPLGIRVFFPAEGNSNFRRSDMLTPGTWTSVVTLNISYQ